ncbi:MAG: helix-turn-helix transcriptional regulator [Oscillospiraceae bacterium]|nr:helix-turn-helix transcriptional regulator [Oscillospiraceae bacterium]
MEDLKVITASNIINLRTAKGMTQAELGELLNYSDKSVSKWERAEAVPDAYVLKKMSEIFGVSVDYLLNSHDSWERPESFKKEERNFHSNVITILVIFGIWTLAFLIYIIGWLLEANWWLLFIYAVPVSLITFLVLNSVWEQGKNNRHIIYALVASVFITVYLTFRSYNPWQILLLLVPAEFLVFLSFRIKKSHK